MPGPRYVAVRLAVILLTVLVSVSAHGGMPAPLPTNWTRENTPSWAPSSSWSYDSGAGEARLQAISFFVACLLLCAWGVYGLWGVLRKDLTWLPILTYKRSLSLVVLWGLLFVIVLTMISGARELMTPGAWRKQGWTYKLNDPATEKPADPRAERRAALERLRQALWQYAATHQGQFPAADDPAIDTAFWDIPFGKGLKFLLVSGRQAEETGRLLVHEPELDRERLVLLTNGMIGSMSTEEIRRALESKSTSPVPQDQPVAVDADAER